MIILDTNVFSAATRPRPDAMVLGWLNEQVQETVWITSITIFEVKMGIELLPSGRRREELDQSFQNALEKGMGGRILSFDSEAAKAAGTLSARRQRVGLNIGIRDTQIAAIALARRATIATRNLKDFHDLGLKIVNPWE